MAESTLSLAYSGLQRSVARYLSYNPDDLTSGQTTRIDEILNAGYRQFLFPPPVPDPDTGRSTTHKWRFLQSISGEMATAADDYDEDLPDDHAYIHGDITIDDDAAEYDTIKQRGEGFIRRLRQQDADQTGVPQFFAVRSKSAPSGTTTGQRFELVLWPTPDGVYDLTYSYAPLPGALTSSVVYAYGGMQHSETVKAACRAVAEQEDNGEMGVEWAKFINRLQASIAADRLTAPSNFGYAGDASDRKHGAQSRTGDYTVSYTNPDTGATL